MILTRRAALDGVQLDSIDNRILIQGIETQAQKSSIQAQALWGTDGSRVTGEYRESLDIILRFTINEKTYRPGERVKVLEKVNSWAAAGGLLTIGYKTDRQIRVILAQSAEEGDAMSRGTYSITFRAFGVPYWQEDPPHKTQINGSSGSRAFGVGGSTRTVMDASFRNTSGGTINNLEIRAGDSVFTFTGLGLGNGQTLIIDHPDDGRRSVLRCRIGSTSVLGKRTGSNDLYVRPGERSVSFTASGSGVMEFSCRGRFV